MSHVCYPGSKSKVPYPTPTYMMKCIKVYANALTRNLTTAMDHVASTKASPFS